MPTGSHLLSRALAVCILLAGTVGVPAWADNYTEVDRMIRAGRPAQALAAADQYLATQPRDPQMLFLRAVALSDAQLNDQAIAAYTQLTQNYPELPEPYNNLAVLYAARNDLDKARELLEMALRTHPGYATAHENLGDIHMRLADRAWRRASQLNPSLSSVGPKLSAVQPLLDKPGATPRPRPAASTALRPASR